MLRFNQESVFSEAGGLCLQLVFDLSIKMPVANGWAERKRRDFQNHTGRLRDEGRRGRKGNQPCEILCRVAIGCFPWWEIRNSTRLSALLGC